MSFLVQLESMGLGGVTRDATGDYLRFGWTHHAEKQKGSARLARWTANQLTTAQRGVFGDSDCKIDLNHRPVAETGWADEVVAAEASGCRGESRPRPTWSQVSESTLAPLLGSARQKIMNSWALRQNLLWHALRYIISGMPGGQ